MNLHPPVDTSPAAATWRLLDDINTIIDLQNPLPEKLQKINHLLMSTLNVDAIWCITGQPLPPMACGLIRTPLTIAPDARVAMVDQAPPVVENWLASSTLLGRAIAGNQPYIVSYNNADEPLIDADLCDVFFSTFEVMPHLIVPLVTHDGALGAIIMGNYETVDSLSLQQQEQLGYLGKYLARNLQNSYLIENAHRYSQTLNTLNQIAHTITSSLDIDDVIRKTMAAINANLDVEAGSLLLLDEAANQLYFKITLRGENKQVTSFRLDIGQGVAGWVFKHNQPTIVNQPRTDSRFLDKIDKAIGFTTTSLLCVPLVVKGKPFGAIEVLNKRSGDFNQDDMHLLVSMAASLGIALQNALLFEDTIKRAFRNERFNQITAAINTGRGLSDTGRLIFEQFGQLFNSDLITFSLIETKSNTIKQWIFDQHGCVEQDYSPFPAEGSRLAAILQSQRGHIENDMGLSADILHPGDQLLLAHNIKSGMGVSLITQKKPYGCLYLHSKQTNAYNSEELTQLEELSSQIAVVIEKALLMDTMQQRTGELHLLNRLSEMLTSTIEISLIVDTAATMLPRILPGDVHGVVIAGDDGAYAGLSVPTGFNNLEQLTQQIFTTLLELREGNTATDLISVKTIETKESIQPDWQPATTFMLPILTRRGAQGIIYTASSSEENFGDDYLRVFSLIVSQISAAVENAHLFQQVEQERARLAAILSSSTDAILVVDKKGRIVLDNPAAWKIIGVKETQRGRLLIESTQLTPLIQLFESTMRGGKTTGEIPLDDGRTFFANLSPVAVGNSGVIGWVATMQDVSHFKELNDLKNEFVSAVSHDLRSPLSSILIATKLIEQSGEITSDQRDLLNMVERRVKGMSELIDDLLDVGHIEAGIDMELESCNLAGIIVEVTVELTPQAADKAIELSTNLATDLPPVLANSTRLRQIVHNLVGNAIKYTPEGGTVTVNAYQKRNEVRLQVIDTGIGIAASDQPHIFEKFYRVKGEYSLKVKGTGLGLSIVKSIVEKLNGRIWLESVFGEGSTFTVALPQTPEAETG